MAADTDNGRVTLAVLGERMLGLDEKIDRLDTKFDKHCDSHGDIDVRLRGAEQAVVRLNEQQGTLARWTVALGVISPAAAGVLAWAATRFGK